jgi:metallo-beta-lactamase family protein
MLGSAHVWLEITEAGRAPRTLLFSGDIGRRDIPIIRDPELPVEGADILLIESTYAGRTHPPYLESESELEKLVLEAHEEDRVVLIPAFAVGRTQQLIVALHRLHDQGRIPGMPVFVDSPLATDVTAVFRLHPETYDEETLESLHKPGNPFSFRALRYTRSVQDSQRLNDLRGPAIIIASSGMLEHGRILHHLRNRIMKEDTLLLITGWQAPHTLGRLLLEGVREVFIHGEPFPVRCEVRSLTGFSGHADQNELDEWVGSMRRKPAHTFVIHGEEQGSLGMATHLQERFQLADVRVPRQGECVEL